MYHFFYYNFYSNFEIHDVQNEYIVKETACEIEHDFEAGFPPSLTHAFLQIILLHDLFGLRAKE